MDKSQEFKNLIHDTRERVNLDDEQTRVLNQYDKYYESLNRELQTFSAAIGEKEAPEKADYRALYDILQRNTDRELKDFDELFAAFEENPTQTNLTKEELYDWGLKLSGFSPRVPGTYSMDRTNAWLKEKLESFGLDVWTEPINFHGVFFHEWSFAVTSPVSKRYAVFPQNNVGFGDISAELVDIGKGFEEDYIGKDVEGKILLMNWGLFYSHEGPCAARERYTLLRLYDIAYAHHAGGIIGYFEDTPGNTFRLLEPGIKPIGGSNVWGPAEVGSDRQYKVPVLSIGRSDAAELRLLLAGGYTEAHMVIRGVRKVSTTNILIGLLPGTGEKAIAAGAHTCTAFEGAGCDTNGVVCALAMAKHFSAVPVEKRKKSLLFFFDSFHVWGNCCQSAITILNRYRTLSENIEAMIWLDHIGNGQADTIHTTTVSDNPVLWPEAAFSQFKYNIAPYVLPTAGIWSICATGAFQRTGIPTVTVQDMDDNLLTPEDTWDKYDPEIVYRDIMAHVDLTDALLKLDVPADVPAEPFGGCGSLFTDVSQPAYPAGESYAPEPDYPLYVGGCDTPVRIVERTNMKTGGKDGPT